MTLRVLGDNRESPGEFVLSNAPAGTRAVGTFRKTVAANVSPNGGVMAAWGQAAPLTIGASFHVSWCGFEEDVFTRRFVGRNLGGCGCANRV